MSYQKFAFMRMHRNNIGIAFLSFWLLLLSCDDSQLEQTLTDYQPHEGDILFQSLANLPLVDMINGMTNSKYTHCGIVEKKDSSWFVLEPYSKVKETRLNKFIGRGVGKTVDVFRLKDTALEAGHIVGGAVGLGFKEESEKWSVYPRVGVFGGLVSLWVQYDILFKRRSFDSDLGLLGTIPISSYKWPGFG